MLISTTFTHTWRTAAATVLAAYPKWNRRVVIALPVLLPLAAVVVKEPYVRVWLIVAPLIMLLVHGKSVRTLVGLGAIDVELDDDGYMRERPGVATSGMRWSATLDVRRQYGLLVIRTMPRAVSTIPESAFTAEQLAVLDEFIRTRHFPTASTA
ncbi:hypothetical protein [Embleya scabrispora]|uniref:hypothetical protein n=1 Tax=Embleya scabrispora TaxID=159449 RepID=UPI00037EAA81|nr:hypothetical protein [Embleya scabrispora]MYS80283.1 hypothetical protein [Streptomyces sp. SID5474]